MNDIVISEYLPKYKYISCTYDYGDYWQHYIELTNVYIGYDKKAPILLSGEGNTPPEDVGGVNEIFIKMAKEWCENNNIGYMDKETQF